jgi:hypothetical protein
MKILNLEDFMIAECEGHGFGIGYGYGDGTGSCDRLNYRASNI